MVRVARRTVPPARPGRDARVDGGGATEAPQPSTRRSSARRRRGRRQHGNNLHVAATNTRPRADPPRLLYSTVHNSLGAAPVPHAARSLSHSTQKAHAVRCPAVPPRRRGYVLYVCGAVGATGCHSPWGTAAMASGPACAGGGGQGSDAAAAAPPDTARTGCGGRRRRRRQRRPQQLLPRRWRWPPPTVASVGSSNSGAETGRAPAAAPGGRASHQ